VSMLNFQMWSRGAGCGLVILSGSIVVLNVTSEVFVLVSMESDAV